MSSYDQVVKEYQKQYKIDSDTAGEPADDPERLPSGIFALDLATGGGIPMQRASVLFGPESSSKTTVALKYIAQAQRQYPDQKPVFIDVEGTFSRQWATQMGVDVDEIGYIKPHSAEQAVDLIDGLAYTDDVSLIVVDSLAALITQKELDSDAEDAMVGVSGLIINKLYRKASRALSKAQTEGRNIGFLLINQIRYKIGVMYGDPETQPGGPSVRFLSSLTLRLYGKDEMVKEVSTSLPAYKKVSVVVKKWKVPIISKNCEFALALLPIPKDGLQVGQSYDMATMYSYLRHLELLAKTGKTYILRDPAGKVVLEAETETAIKTKIATDQKLGQAVRGMIVQRVMERGDIIDTGG